MMSGIESIITPSPRLVRQIVQDEEIPRRNKYMNPAVVQAVFRYGAMAGSVIERFNHLKSGMDYARRMIRETEEKGDSFRSGTVIFVDELSGGKGRFQRPWHAPRGGLWMTLVLANTLLPESTRLYPLAAGVACCEVIRQYDVDARIKWVNDVLAGGRKLAGILSETMIGPRYGEEYILIGVGINVNNDAFPEELVPIACSLKNFLDAEVDVGELAARLLACFSWNIGLLHYEEERLLEKGGHFVGQEAGNHGDHLLIKRFRELSDTVGRRVLFGFDVQKEPQYEAKVLNINDQGGLVLRNAATGDGIVEYSGEIAYLD